ncbi:MAG: hypothetical protein QF596_00565 [Acidimicrobiales bacterium]|jgi:hypothetical protein|nr:hypothetical protein [Acidimicrobiales bacterium]MDP6299208.1 hypothetical protein [Acidimicrobiales bacterium]HJM28302.1 hypothetical protein [Acidimicrobiales bacterium]HJM98588.1 hypothetical protein [Acidimicrobiales bacterium]
MSERAVNEIPVSHTPSGGWTVFPEPILQGCVDPLPLTAPDMRGMWKVIEVSVAGARDSDHEMVGSQQRIEQAADRIVITSEGIIHDMRCDGTVEHGVHDVSVDFTTEITVVATYEDGVHVLRPVGTPIEVRRHLEGEELVWEYGPFFTARLERTSP